MAYDEELAGRVRRVTRGREGLSEKKMFGGLAVLVNGNMGCGVVGDELMVRVGPEGYESALREPHARPMDFTGKPLRGFVYVAAAGIADQRSLSAWVRRGLEVAAALPPKR